MEPGDRPVEYAERLMMDRYTPHDASFADFGSGEALGLLASLGLRAALGVSATLRGAYVHAGL